MTEGANVHRADECDRCHRLCVMKDDRLRGPLEGQYEYLCGRCARQEEMFRTLVWKGRG